MEHMSAAMDPSQAASVTLEPDVYDDGFLRIEHNSYYVSCNGVSLSTRRCLGSKYMRQRSISTKR